MKKKKKTVHRAGIVQGSTPAPYLWRLDESMSSNYSTSNNTNVNFLLLCAVRGLGVKKEKVKSLNLPHPFFYLLYLTALPPLWEASLKSVCVAAVRWSAHCNVSLAPACSEMVKSSSESQFCLTGWDRRGKGQWENPKFALPFPLTQCPCHCWNRFNGHKLFAVTFN